MASQGTFAALRSVWTNPAIRRSQLALAGSTIGDWSYGVAISVLVFERAGASWVALSQVCRFVPAALAAPFLAALVDRYPKQRVLFMTDVVRALLMAAMLACAAAHAPLVGLVALSAVNMLVGTLFWPAQAAMLPSLVREPEELAAANVTQSTVEATGSFIGPAIGAAVLGAFGITAAFAVPTAAYVLSAVAVTRVRPPVAHDGQGDSANGSEDGAEARLRSALLGGLAAIVHNPDVRVLMTLFGAQVIVCGMLNVLMIVAAFQVLHAGNSGVGLLLVALGIGGLIGSLPALALSQRARLTTVFAVGLVLWGVPIALIALARGLPLAFAMLVLVGVGNTLVDVSAITLLQRATPPEVLGRVFGVLESVMIASVALGAAVTPFALHLVGARATFVLTGAILPVVTLLFWRRLRRLDEVTADGRRLELLRGDPIFASLPEAILETLAGALTPLALDAGDVVFHAGDEGDHYYLVDEGGVSVDLADGHPVTLKPGDGFGEIALIRDVPRTATVSASELTSLLALRGEEFVAAITGHAPSAEAAHAVIAQRLRNLRPALASV